MYKLMLPLGDARRTAVILKVTGVSGITNDYILVNAHNPLSIIKELQELNIVCPVVDQPGGVRGLDVI